ncbi:MAG: class I SAM-dependent methyltransferase [Patescibacteria group bacterium]|nr:class I SAM-dependent methyltransferase [Patescibacteria group bacterium]
MLSPAEKENLETYNKIAAAWTKLRADDFWLPELEKFRGYLPAGKVLDLGCGSGRDSHWLLKFGFEVWGVDFSEEQIRLARAKNPAARYFVQNFYELDLPAESFDGLWAANSLLHVPKQNVAAVLQKVKAVLKPKAVAFISMKEGRGQQMEEWHHSGHKRFFVYYQQDEFGDILQNSGFTVLEKYKFSKRTSYQKDSFLIYFVRRV